MGSRPELTNSHSGREPKSASQKCPPKEYFSEGVFIAIARANPNDLFHVPDEDFAIANFTSARCAGDGFNDLIDLGFFDNDLNFDLGQQVNCVFRATVPFNVTLLPATAADISDRHAHDADIGESTLDIL